MRTLLVFLLLLQSLYLIAQVDFILPSPKISNIDTSQHHNFGKDFFIKLNPGQNSLLESLNNNAHNITVTSIHEKESNGLQIKPNFYLHPNYFKQELSKDSYTLDIQPGEIHIYYDSEAAAYMAFQSLLQLSHKTENDEIILPESHIYDYPDFAWRGLHLDCSRHFFTTDEIKAFLTTMAHYKFNKFHWHLTDDQGWRVEIEKYPKLTKIGAYRDSTKIGHFNEFEKGYKNERYGGYYTKEDLKNIVAFASRLHIEVIPEIEMPGHARAALAAYPKLGCSKEELPVASTWGIFNEVFCSKQKSLDFLKDVIDEIAPLFPSKYFHIGGDEAPSIQREKCKHCQKTIKKHHLHNEHEVQGYILKEINQHLKKHNKTLIGWDEIIESGLPDDFAVMSWRGMQGGIEAAKSKHDVVMSPTTYCYFDYYQSDNPNEPLAIGGYLPLEKVYQFSPIPPSLDSVYHQYILGGQANLWTEYIPNFDQLMYMTYPRALALSEKLWNQSAIDYKDFLNKVLELHLPYLKEHNINYSKAIADANFILSSPNMGSLDIAVENKNPLIATITNFRNISTSSKTDFQLRLPEHKTQDTIYLASFAEGIEDREKEITIYLSQSTGCTIDSLTQPHPKFNNGGSFTLVNGVYGRRPWNGSDWLGYSGDTITAIFDLQEEREVYNLQLSCLKAEGSWIYLPEKVSVLGSNDKVNYHTINSPKVTEEITNVLLYNSYRYIKLVVSPIDKIPDGKEGAGQNPWTFIDEIKITWK